MRKIKVTVGTSKVGSDCTRIIEVEDDAIEKEINDEAW